MSRPLMSQRKMPPGRGSSSESRPIHWTSLSGSVKKSKIVSGLASTLTSISTAAAVSALATLVSPLLFELGGELQPREAVGPELAEEVLEVGHALGAGAVEPAGALAPLAEEAGVLEHGEMLGDGRAGDVEFGGD